MARRKIAEFVLVEGRPTVRGECDSSNAAELKAWLIGFGQKPLEVDLSEVTFLDAAALDAFIVAALNNPRLRVVKPSPPVQRVLDITRTRWLLAD